MDNKTNSREFKKYRAIMRFALEETRQDDLERREKYIQELENSFYDSIYFERDLLEQEIKEDILFDSSVLTIQGTEGCGKTTVLKKVADELHQDGYPCIKLDFNFLYHDVFVECRDEPSWINKIGEQLSKTISQKHFSLSDDDNLEFLYESYLFPEEKQTKIESNDLTRELIEEYKYKKSEVPEHERKLKEWYRNNKFENETIRSIRNKILDRTNYAHYILAFMKITKNHNKMIVILDNVDRIPREYQPNCFHFGIDFYNNLKHCAKIIVCIREENAHYPRNSAAIQSAAITPLKVLDKKAKDRRRQILDPYDFHKILQRRYDFYKDYAEDNNFCELIGSLTNFLKREYAEFLLIDLANQSIRTALDYHCIFVYHLIKKYSESRDINKIERILNTYKNKPGKVSSFLNSHLFGWIAKYTEDLDMQSLNIVKLYSACRSKDYRAVGCDLGYLILVNLNNERGPVKLSKIIQNLAILGFEKSDIKKRIYELYNLRNREFGYVITIWNDDIIEDVDSLKDYTKIEINYRGKTLIDSIATSFTFISRLLFFTDYYKGRKSLVGNYYNFRNVVNHSRNNLRFLSKIAWLHSLELIRICIKMNDRNWLAKYKRRFCVKNQLQLEKIIESNKKYLEKVKPHLDKNGDENQIVVHIKIFDKLMKLYQNQIETLTSDTIEIYKYADIIEDMLKDKNKIHNDFNDGKYKQNIKRYINV
jgi:hypothetical protein